VNDPADGTEGKVPGRGFFARAVRRFAVVLILAWLAVAVVSNLAVPSLEQIAKEHAVSLSIQDAPSMKARNHIGAVFNEPAGDGMAMVVLDSQEPLGDAAHQYYDELVRQFNAESTHVLRVQDFWGDPMTAQAVQSADGKAAYVQLFLAGNQGENLANDSVEAVRAIVERTPAPDGVKAYVTGPTPLSADLAHIGDKAAVKITIATAVVIAIMLLLVYRSISTVTLVLVMMGIVLAAVRGVVATLAHFGLVGVSAFGISILVALAIAAGTDYTIFFIGRYHEARQAGEDRESAYYTTTRSVSHVIVASGLTVAGALFCLIFTRLPMFQTMGVPCGVGMLVAVAAALTLVPAVITVGSRFGLLEPKRTMSARGWRRVGTAIVRWPLPIFLTTCAIAMVGLLALPGYRVGYADRPYMPADAPANIGWAAADDHFSQAQLMPEILMVESEKDMRNSADMLVLNKLAEDLFNVEGIARVQGVTRPEGSALKHTSLPSLLSAQAASQQQNVQFVRDRLEDMKSQADGLDSTIATMQRAYTLMQQLTASSKHMIGVSREMVELSKQMRDDVTDINNSFNRYDKILNSDRCDDIATCEALKSGRQAGLSAADSANKLTDKLDELGPDLSNLDTVGPQLIELLPAQIETLQSVQGIIRTTYSTMSGILGQTEELGANAAAMGKDFDAAQTSESFYLPREAFQNPDFQRVVTTFMSPDGKAARFIITHRGSPATAEGLARIDRLETAAVESLKGTPLADATIWVAGTASILKDLQEAWSYDILIAGLASLCIVFIIILVITRSIIAALVIVGTVVASLAASFGLSVLVWQHIIGIELHWMVMLMAIIILLAVGADYNLLLVSRMKEESGAGLKTGMIRAMGGTGKIVTLAGLVFAFTMAAMMVSDLLVIGQVGTTIALGLLFDTLIVRSFMMPSAAALLGRWFWWPLKVQTRPRRVPYPNGVDEHPVQDRSSSAASGAEVVALTSLRT
jgi:RND superfamily putative drug exporter